MIDFGFDKIALIGAVALIVIGPEKLPRVARTVGHLLGKAQRYVADVKAEVNRSIELEDLKKMKTEFEDAARNVEETVHNTVHQTNAELQQAWGSGGKSSLPEHSGQHEGYRPQPYDHHSTDYSSTSYKRPRKNWRAKRSAMPHWAKQRLGVKNKVLSGAARVARFRPKRSSVGARRTFQT
jgi:sec-independent protein translocase protein TatB